MNFIFNNQSDCNNRQELCFFYKNSRTYLLFKFYGPLHNLPCQIQEKFIQTTVESVDGGTLLSLYGFPSIDNEKPLCESALFTGDYHIHEPRIIAEQEASLVKECAPEDLVPILQTKKLLFYTGAGISAEVVPAMDPLVASLGLSSVTGKEMVDTFIIDLVTNPQHYVKVMDAFYTSCFYGEPTSAHYALTALAHSTKSKIITENLDFLHMNTGIEVPVAEAEWILSNIDPHDLKKIDALICIGLKWDERGFLGWYKHHNPTGIIIALNLEKPCYLGTNDLFIRGDAQKILPHISVLLEKASALYKPFVLK